MDASQDETIHDFSSVPIIMQIFGGYVLLKKRDPKICLYILCSLLIFLFEIFMAGLYVTSIFRSSFDKGITMQLGQILIFWIGSIAARAIFIYTIDSIEIADILLNDGLFSYEGIEVDEINIKKLTVGKIKLFLSIYSKLLWFTFISLSFGVPLAKYLIFNNEGRSDPFVNKYLPQPIYMPFNTNSVLGYSCALLMVTILLFTMIATALCHAQVTMSTALQFSAQIELLNYSLKNIEKRALAKLIRTGLQIDQNAHIEKLYFLQEFQRFLYLCLKENVIHHQAIIR